MALIQEFEKISNSAIAAPSANRFGQVSPTSSSDVYDELGEYLSDSDIVLNGGTSSIGIESTIIDCTGMGPVILRPGFITTEDIQSLLGDVMLENSRPRDMKFSGVFEKHYAPEAEVFLEVDPEKNDGFIALNSIPTTSYVIRLSSPKEVNEFARSLYSALRNADRLGIKRIVIAQPQGNGLAAAIRDRLAKAAKGR